MLCCFSNLVICEGKNLSRVIFASVNYFSRKTCHIFHLHYQGKLVKETLLALFSLLNWKSPHTHPLPAANFWQAPFRERLFFIFVTAKAVFPMQKYSEILRVMANLHGRTFTLEYSVPKLNGRVTSALRKMYVISLPVDLRETWPSGAYLKLHQERLKFI